MNDKLKILIIDDEIPILEMIQNVYRDKYQVYVTNNGESVVAMAEQINPDAILLDLKMPNADGYQVLEKMRKSPTGVVVPILVVTALKDTVNKIKAFRLGADDFVTKPLHPEELSVRIESKVERFRELRKNGGLQAMRIGNISMNTAKQTLEVNGNEVDLTKIEFKILECIIEREGALLKREELIREVWADEPVSERILDAHMSSLRKKMQGSEYQVVTVYNSGFRFKEVKSVKE